MAVNKIRSFKKSSIRDVAAAAGVSVTTISYFVGGRESVCSAETAVRIRNAIKDLHYTPSTPTRGLRQRATETIGVVVDDPVEVFNHPHETFTLRLWSGIVDEADTGDYGLLHYPASVRHGLGAARILDGRVDGLLIKPGFDDNRATLTAQAGLPTVVFDRYTNLPDACGAVCSQEPVVVDLALSHLWDLGHRRIAHLAGPAAAVPDEEFACPRTDTSEIATVRRSLTISWLSERSALDRALLATSGRWVIPVDAATDTLRRWMAREDPPTAVFCADDAMAVSMIAAARRLGLAVPDDLSIVGIDNGIQARDCTPGLTTVDIPVEEVGRQGVRALIRMMHGENYESCRYWIPPTGLVQRASTGPYPSVRRRSSRARLSARQV